MQGLCIKLEDSGSFNSGLTSIESSLVAQW